MKKIFVCLLILISLLSVSCKKKNDTTPVNNNEVNATVVIPGGATIVVNARGAKASMGCALLGGGSFVSGVNEANAAVYINYVYGAGFSCVSIPGTYNFSCEYRKNIADPATPVWTNNGANKGSITFTAINDHYMEGSFNAVSRCNSPGCVFGVDSVIISGTFKGNY